MSDIIPARTSTGHFPIGLRRGWSAWQRDLPGLLDWMREHSLGTVDFGPDGADFNAPVREAGLRIGTIDLPEMPGLLSPDPTERAKALRQAAALIERAVAGFGRLIFLTVMVAKDPARPRRENFGYLVESYQRLAPVLEAHGSRLVVEGWPGPGCLCCTPEGVDAFFKHCPSPAFGLNYDPSHLVRMGIDPLRFLRDYGARIFHVHGKDTALSEEGRYRYGTEQPATFAAPTRFGGLHWRYCLPGHGTADWPAILRLLDASGYRGTISLELEDETFLGTEAGEKKGLLAARDFLAGC